MRLLLQYREWLAANLWLFLGRKPSTDGVNIELDTISQTDSRQTT